ncbi:Endo-1,4-beta-xylanase D protein [Rutstroemia sp. NJR-2017a WRK4]|nr:Endo-1,4-beta-xylanase D protein [Rutstroemia sp. NJR-2017a WRK4]
MHYSKLVTLAALPAAYAQLNTLAKAAGLKYFGSATDNGELTDTQYTAILSNTSEFGQITPGNTMKWQFIEPSQNTFDFSGGDVIANLAKTNGQLLRCHNLVWHSQLPDWVSSGTWTNATLIAAMKNHIKGEVTHYKGQCYAWDVVNEALNEDGTFREDVFLNTIGPEYIPIAFETAALYDPDVKLYYNDYNIEYTGAKSAAAAALVASLKARGIKIDGVGLQAHFVVGGTPSNSDLISVLKSYTTQGVEAAYTELDIRFSALPEDSAGLAQQATDYASVVSACLSVNGCIGITIWDFVDKYSWIPSTFPGQGDADLWFSNFTHHPAYDSVASVLKAAATAKPVTSTTVSSTSSVATSGCSAPVVSTTTTPTPTSTLKTSTTTKSSSTPTATGKTVPLYGQCGGKTYTGSTVCAAPAKCKYSNDYYSQCLA